MLLKRSPFINFSKSEIKTFEMSKNPFPVNKPKKIEKEFLFVGGTIGAGKSTIVQKLITSFPNKNVQLIKEYIDWDEYGEQRLNAFLSKRMTAFDFQRYVIECYFRQFIEARADMFIFERHPVESIVFATRFCSEEEVEKLYDFCWNMCREYGIPMPTDCDFMEVTNNGDCIDPVIDQIKVRKLARKCLFVHVEVDGKVQMTRMMKRGRHSDHEYLMEKGREYLRRVNMNYNALPVFRYDIKPESFYIFYRRDHHVPIPMIFNFDDDEINSND